MNFIRNFGGCMFFMALGVMFRGCFIDTSDSNQIPPAIIFGLIGLGIAYAAAKAIERKKKG
jgi:hypothetical protein